MVTKEQVERARQAWQAATETAALEHENWSTLLRSRLKLICSLTESGTAYKPPEQEADRYSDAQRNVYVAADEAMDKCCEEYLALANQFDSTTPGHRLCDQSIDCIWSTQKVYSSSTGDRWDLLLSGASEATLVRHTPNLSSGGKVRETSVEEFLSTDGHGPEHDALRALLRHLADGAKK